MNYFSVDSWVKIPAETHFIKLLSTGHGKNFSAFKLAEFWPSIKKIQGCLKI
ncbi:hypothetical protein [Limnohabitans sp. B9-3]|jgi:hypothetical protein|uniref:hypothetical protein n=1 Tax=Limnohabitans sp. B9-3 TaxID=1100707 RepID=UPI0013041098|nr:hypothetical protein [Limnohabitans sp. B9-3]